MCVIAVCEKKIPPLDDLLLMEKANPDGGGLAWREKGKVLFEKGLTAQEIHQKIKRLPLPVVIHFRLGTSGGKCPELCHPFPIQEDVPLILKGEAKAVLFHNGIWRDWKELCLKTVIYHKKKFPGGKMSDTRAMAWFCSVHGESVLTLIDEKVVVFTPSQITLYGNGWTEKNGIIYSNLYWENTFDVRNITPKWWK